MKSIRFSLLLYFLGLLALAVGTASLLAYQTAQRTLEAKKATTVELIEAQYRERCKQEERRLDDSLLLQAQALAKVVQIIDWNRNRYQSLHVLGLLTSNLTPNGYASAPIWIGQAGRRPRSGEPTPSDLFTVIFSINLPKITLNEDDLPEHDEKEQADYIQVETRSTTPYRSPSLGEERLPLDQHSFSPDQVLHSEVDEVTLPSGKLIRRVVLKTPAARFMGPWPSGFDPRRSRGGQQPSVRPSQFPASPERNERRPPPMPSLYIHCAYDINRYSEKLAEFGSRRDEEIQALGDETRTAQASVRNRLLLIGSLTFLAALAGSFWLVRLGLAPLQRLSEAVRQVSPRDFRLPFTDDRLPSELKPIAQRLKETLELLKRAFAREKQATADISHELRTPLAVLLTTTELGLRKPRSAEQYREMLQDCRLSAQQMNEIVNRLLTLARLDAGVEQLQRRTIDVAELADQCATLVRPLAEAQGLTLQVHHEPIMSAQTDPDKLREVLNNLLHNAIQYNRPNGRIDLRVGQSQDKLWMEVADTGIGISPDARPQIFERFYRADASRTGDGMHAGLGLALVKEYIDLMGGRIDVESQEGQGSTFRIWLPA